MKILQEFERRYRGDVSQTRAICEDIADTFDLNPEEVLMYVYIHRYEEDTKEEPEEPEEPEDF